MQGFQPAPKAWLLDSSETTSSHTERDLPSVTTPASELADALAPIARHGMGLGDAFVFGRCAEVHERALVEALPDDMRTFGCVEGAASVRRGRPSLQTHELDDSTLRAWRARHHIRRVSLLVVADDFAWSLGRVVHAVRDLIASQALLLVAGGQAALLETLWLDELRTGQRGFEVARLEAPAASWARFTLRRRQYA